MPTEVIMPKVDMDMDTGTVAVWYFEDGQDVEKGAALFDIETDKATMEVESPATGKLHFVVGKKGDVIPIGGTVAWIFAEGEDVVEPKAATQSSEGATASTQSPALSDNGALSEQAISIPLIVDVISGIRATPLARRIARSNNIDLTNVQGTGPRGRITRSDVDENLQKTPAATSSLALAVATIDAKKIADKLGIKYTEIPVDRMRATIAARLTESKSTIPHFYLQIDCNIDALLKFRSEINSALEASGQKRISINDMLIRASALSLAAVPEANASWAGDSIIRYKEANISVAVAIDGGLITPVVKQAQLKSMQVISSEVADLAARAKAGKLSQSEYQGGSFSISNLGMFGIKSFSAIVNPPESMILAVGKAVKQFIPDSDGNPLAANTLSVTLSCDHRVVDGALGAQWLNHFQNLIENPLLLTLEPAGNLSDA